MRLPPCPALTFPSLILLLLPFIATAISFDCSDIRVDGKAFGLKPLEGPHSVYRVRDHPPSLTNTTFTLDICRPLEKTKGVPKDEDCPNGSRVCAIERLTNLVENVTTIEHTIPIAGEFSHSIGGALDPKVTRMKSSPSSADREKEGIRLELNGGKYEGKTQKAIVEFLCGSNEQERKREVREAEDDEDNERNKSGEEANDEHGGLMKLLSWEDEEDMKVLRLEWTTKYACEDSKDDKNGSSSGHWGFFTWFIIIVFMAVAAYLVFGSWLNYNRYSARGWDIVPHSDTLQDLPYLFRDWMRRVVNTVQGGGSRGGYSAV